MTFSDLVTEARRTVDRFGLETASVNVEVGHWSRDHKMSSRRTELTFRIFVSHRGGDWYFVVDSDDPDTVLALLASKCREKTGAPQHSSLESIGDVSLDLAGMVKGMANGLNSQAAGK